MRKLGLALFLALGLAPAQAQNTTFTMPPPAGVIVGGAQIVANCGTATLSTGSGQAVVTMDTTGRVCDGGGPVPLGTVNGWTPKLLTGLTNSAVAVKTTTGWVGKVYCDNNNAAWTYVQLFNATTANVTVGTTTPLEIVPLAPSLAGGFVMDVVGDQFSTAISAAATTTPTGSSAPATNTINCTVSYN